MCHYQHLTLTEREDIMCLRKEGRSVNFIARSIGRNPSTVSRELKRNSSEVYRASVAQECYRKRRKACRRHILLADKDLFDLVADKLIDKQWSPEQIEGRLRKEGAAQTISRSTIYRGIYSGIFDHVCKEPAKRRLRHHGKKRRVLGVEDHRGKINIVHEINERPKVVDKRKRLGDWEADTVAGKGHGACLVALVDRKSGYLVGGLSSAKKAEPVTKVMTKALKDQPLCSVTSDRGKEFADHAQITKALDVEFYFALPHHPWQRAINENTNGLLREYFPRRKALENVTEDEVQAVYDKINKRPRKRLGYRTPYEVHYNEVLHLI